METLTNEQIENRVAIANKSSHFDKELLKELKEELDIDFRRDVFLENQYAATPSIGYARMKEIVLKANDILEDKYGDIRIWNFDMDMERLRTTRLKDYLDDLFDLRENAEYWCCNNSEN